MPAMARLGILACTGLALWCGCSPYGGGSFACEEDSQCGPSARCADGYCAFPDPTCDSDFRYGDHSGPMSGQCVGGEQGEDGGVDVDTMPGHCYGTGLVTACFDAVPTGSITVTTNTTINTDTDERCAPTLNAVPACVVAAESITVNGGLFLAATGTKPLVLVATQTITVDGTLTVGSFRQLNFVGAGSDMPGCDTGVAPGGSAGGAGGSFGGMGGNGGAVGTAGMAGATLAVTELRGGCSGQPGGDATAPLGPGAAGRGGGALYLIAETSIAVAGTVSAGGGGGGGGAAGASAGGGGGGSGGFIGFDTPALMIAGSAHANGGGGGEGSSQAAGAPGGDATSATNQAQGGTGGTSFGANGGDGAAGTMLNGEAGSNTCGGACTTPTSGGGGGGGAGVIKLYRATSASGGGTISPAPM